MRSEARSSWPFEAGRLALISVLLVSAGYLVRLPVEISLGQGILGALTTENFHDAEGDYRWTRQRSSIRFPDPGSGLDVRIDALVSGSRHGQDPPLVVMETGGKSLRARPGRRETLSLMTTTRGWWSSDLEVLFRSETHTPGEEDRRALGARVHRVRLVPEGSSIGLGRAPLRQIVTTTVGLILLLALLGRRSHSLRMAGRMGSGLALVWGIGFAFARPYAALASTPFLIITGIALFMDMAFPSCFSTFAESLRECRRAFRRGLEGLAHWPSLGLVVAGTVGVTAAYLARPTLDIDLGTGRETTLVDRFAGFDQVEGVTFRRALRGARIDLTDFGGGTTWKMEVTASLADGPRNLVLARAGGQEIETKLDGRWSNHELRSRSPFGWRAGLTVEFPSATEALPLSVDRIRIDRGSSLPSLRIIAFVVGAALMTTAGLGACGVTGAKIWIAAAALLIGTCTALGLDPVLLTPFIPTFSIVIVGGSFFATVAFGFLSVAARRRLIPNPAPLAVGAAGLGFIAWMSACLFPLYEGGHFVFHSSIAEEIWQGSFLTYYLPYPGSMLSRQAQWGNLIIPHSCLYHTLMAPLAALPRVWFHGLEKTALALMLSMSAIMASLLATRAGGRRAGEYTGFIAVGLVPPFRLLGLGHLMTLFGVFTATLAVGFIILRFEDLEQRSTWWWSTFLLTLCFLSYTASFLMTVITLAVALPFLLWKAPGPARALVGAGATATLAAFLLYYVQWTAPFLRESLPQLLSGAVSDGSALALGSRLAGVPSKLTYSYGSPVVPLLGLLGILWAARNHPTCDLLLMASWSGILVLFSGADLFFNFLLKHHYFTYPVIAVGGGLLAARAAKIGRPKGWGWGLAAVFVVYVWVMGATAALSVALS